MKKEFEDLHQNVQKQWAVYQKIFWFCDENLVFYYKSLNFVAMRQNISGPMKIFVLKFVRKHNFICEMKFENLWRVWRVWPERTTTPRWVWPERTDNNGLFIKKYWVFMIKVSTLLIWDKNFQVQWKTFVKLAQKHNFTIDKNSHLMTNFAIYGQF